MFQQSVLRHMVDEEAFCFMCTEHLRSNFFENAALGWIFGAIQRHSVAYSRPPNFMVLYEELRRLDPLLAAQYQPTLDAIYRTPPSEPEYVGSKVMDFVKRNVFFESFEYVRKLYNDGKADDAYDAWQRASEDIQKISLEQVDRGFFFEDFEARHSQRVHAANTFDFSTFSTGIPELDLVLDGGLSLGELGAWIAYQKVGKSYMLAWLAFYAVRALQIPVLVTVHEGSREYWEARLDAAWADTFVNLVKRGELTHERHREMAAEYEQLKGLLVVRGYTKGEQTWSANAQDIYGELKDLRVRHGFRPKMIVIDYADLLRARTHANSETEHQTAAWRDIKTLTSADQGYAIWTASQAQRKNPRADRDPDFVVRAEHVADAIGKVRTADFYGSINRTMEEKQNHRARLFAEDYRGGEAGKIIEVETDYGHGRFVRSIISQRDAPVVPSADA
jgi:replicative DNA helicase